MAIATPQYRMADRLAKGRLADVLAEFKAQGASTHLVTRELYARFGIEVTAPTVGVWFSKLDSPAEAAS